MTKIYAQLYSVKDYMKKDFAKTLEAIAEIGYTGVEFAGYGDYTSKALKEKLDALNLVGISSHVPLEKLKDNLDEEIKFLKAIGGKYMVCPYAEIHTLEQAKEHAILFNQIGEACYKEGLVFAYHNHSHELVKDQGKYPLEVLFEEVNEQYVKQEVDLYWVAYAGIDPLEYLEKNSNRCELIHLKQMDNMEKKKNVEAGQGFIDFKKIINDVKDHVLIYEQEVYEGDSMDSMANSLEALLKL